MTTPPSMTEVMTLKECVTCGAVDFWNKPQCPRCAGRWLQAVIIDINCGAFSYREIANRRNCRRSTVQSIAKQIRHLRPDKCCADCGGVISGSRYTRCYWCMHAEWLIGHFLRNYEVTP